MYVKISILARHSDEVCSLVLPTYHSSCWPLFVESKNTSLVQNVNSLVLKEVNISPIVPFESEWPY